MKMTGRRPRAHERSASPAQCFTLETPQSFRIVCHARQQYFDGDFAVQASVPSAIYRAHAALAQRRDYVIRPQPGTRLETHWFFVIRGGIIQESRISLIDLKQGFEVNPRSRAVWVSCSACKRGAARATLRVCRCRSNCTSPSTHRSWATICRELKVSGSGELIVANETILR